MLARYLGPGLLGLGVTGWCRIHGGMAGKSAPSDSMDLRLYRPYLRKSATDAHYVSMGRWCTIIGFFEHWNGLCGDGIRQHHGLCAGFVQLLYRAPVRDVVIGMLWKRITPAGGFTGCWPARFRRSGCSFWSSSIGYAVVIALSTNAKPLAEDMYRALWSSLIGVIVTVAVSLATKPKPDAELVNLFSSDEYSERGRRALVSGLYSGQRW